MLWLVLLLLLPARAARADRVSDALSRGTLFFFNGALLVIGAPYEIVLAIENHRKITGCLRQGTHEFELADEKTGVDYRVFSHGDVTFQLRANERMQLQGDRAVQKGGRPWFTVAKVRQDYGPCPATPPGPPAPREMHLPHSAILNSESPQ